MSETGEELKYIKEAFYTNWVVPLGPNVDGFEKDLENFVTQKSQIAQKDCNCLALTLQLNTKSLNNS